MGNRKCNTRKKEKNKKKMQNVEKNAFPRGQIQINGRGPMTKEGANVMGGVRIEKEAVLRLQVIFSVARA